MVLHSWRSVGRRCEFDVVSGRLRAHEADGRPDSEPTSAGCFAREWSTAARRVSFALYRDGDREYFQVGADRWNVADPSVSFSFRRGVWPFCATFAVLREGKKAYEISYFCVWRMLWMRMDPTYDGIDVALDHFLLHVASKSRFGG